MGADHQPGPVETLLGRLEGVTRLNGFHRAFCPAHDDRNTPNLDVKEGEDGRALIICRAGCDAERVVEALGLETRDLFPRTDKAGERGGSLVSTGTPSMRAGGIRGTRSCRLAGPGNVPGGPEHHTILRRCFRLPSAGRGTALGAPGPPCRIRAVFV